MGVLEKLFERVKNAKNLPLGLSQEATERCSPLEIDIRLRKQETIPGAMTNIPSNDCAMNIGKPLPLEQWESISKRKKGLLDSFTSLTLLKEVYKFFRKYALNYY